jgi:glc operon protein GlcG
VKNLFLSLVFSLISTVSFAQTVSETYELTLEGAKQIMISAQAYAKTHNAPGGAIAIVDATGNLVLFERLNGSFPIASQVSCEKARTAALFRMPTQKFEEGINGGRVALTTVGENMLKGGLPIIYKGKVIGGIGVSGAASADQDAEIAKAGVETNLVK